MSKNGSMTSIKIQSQVFQKMCETVIQNGYGMRGKSKWIVEAIESFLAIPAYPEFVEIAEDDGGAQTEIMSIRLPKELANKIDESVIEVRKLFPGLEGVRSKIIRTSIIQRLFRS